MINFNVPCQTGAELDNLKRVFELNHLSGDGIFTKKCHNWFETTLQTKKALLTTSCTHALDMAAMLANIQPGDEVIMASYTFTSTANAFALRDAKIIFCDIRPDTMNIDENVIESAITKKTKAICVMHYAGVACEMKKILDIAKKNDLLVIEDAAQGVMSKYNNHFLGTIGDIGCFSFHETKNYTCGEGGALLLNKPEYIERAEIIREKGTDRSKFFRGQVDKYGWVDIGSSYLPSELNAAYLYAQLEKAVEINNDRLNSWQHYAKALAGLKQAGIIDLPHIPESCTHNAHMFYIKTKDLNERTKLIAHLKQNEVMAVFHYIPLHSSKAGLKFGAFAGEDRWTTKESERLLRLPLYYGITKGQLDHICEKIISFYKK
jgi:dTDP-4-amino-4,6-dideoxygalactose transaminase